MEATLSKNTKGRGAPTEDPDNITVQMSYSGIRAKVLALRDALREEKGVPTISMGMALALVVQAEIERRKGARG